MHPFIFHSDVNRLGKIFCSRPKCVCVVVFIFLHLEFERLIQARRAPMPVAHMSKSKFYPPPHHLFLHCVASVRVLDPSVTSFQCDGNVVLNVQ